MQHRTRHPSPSSVPNMSMPPPRNPNSSKVFASYTIYHATTTNHSTNQDIPTHSTPKATILWQVQDNSSKSYRSSVSNCFRASAITFCKYNNSSTLPNFLGSFRKTILKSSTLSLCLGAAILAASMHYPVSVSAPKKESSFPRHSHARATEVSGERSFWREDGKYHFIDILCDDFFKHSDTFGIGIWIISKGIH